jgi:acetyl esterase
MTTLDPQAKALIDMVYRVGAPRFHDLDVAKARHSFQKLQFALRPEAPGVASVTDVPIPRSHARDGVIMGRLYRPLNSRSDDALPLVFYFHGGGWCVGDLASYDVLCRELAHQSGAAVLSVDYALAPEHPFPAAVNDALRAVEWSLENAALLGVDPARFALMGDSAGGTLSAVTALQLRDLQGPQPALQVLVYPCTDIRSTRPSRSAYANGYMLDEGSLVWFFEKYLPNAADHADWRASPLLAPDLAELPPALLILAGCDPLVDDGLAYADALRAAGSRAETVVYPGLVHGFFTLGKFFPQAGEAVQRCAQALAQAFA